MLLWAAVLALTLVLFGGAAWGWVLAKVDILSVLVDGSSMTLRWYAVMASDAYDVEMAVRLAARPQAMGTVAGSRLNIHSERSGGGWTKGLS